jgi:acyl-CoA synthetase (AMP-forming)/AMP-acid ligase II
MTDPARTVFAALEQAAARRPDHPAIVFGDETLSYARLMSLVQDAALHLRSLGLGQGSVFAAYSPNRPELVLCYYAAARIGAVFVPVNPNLTPAEVAYTFRHSGAELLLCDASVAEIAAAAVPDGRVIPLDVLRSPAPAIEPQPPAEVRPEDPFPGDLHLGHHGHAEGHRAGPRGADGGPPRAGRNVGRDRPRHHAGRAAAGVSLRPVHRGRRRAAKRRHGRHPAALSPARRA